MGIVALPPDQLRLPFPSFQQDSDMIADSVIMGLLAALGFGLAEFASALLARRTSHFRLMFGVNLASVIAASAYAPFDGRILQASTGHWLTAVGLGILYTATYFLYYAALQRGPVTLVSPIMSVYKGVVIILAVLVLAERMSPGQSAGAAAALLGVFLASINLADLKGGRLVIGRGVIFGLLAMVAFGVFYYSIAALSRDLGWFLPVFMIRMFTALLAAPIAISRPPSPDRPLTPRLALAIFAIGAVEIAAMFAFARGAQVGVVAIVAAVSSTYTLVPVIGAIIILRERLRTFQIIGIVSVVAGVTLLSAA